MSIIKSVCYVVHERSYNLFSPFGFFLLWKISSRRRPHPTTRKTKAEKKNIGTLYTSILGPGVINIMTVYPCIIL